MLGSVERPINTIVKCSPTQFYQGSLGKGKGSSTLAQGKGDTWAKTKTGNHQACTTSRSLPYLLMSPNFSLMASQLLPVRLIGKKKYGKYIEESKSTYNRTMGENHY